MAYQKAQSLHGLKILLQYYYRERDYFFKEIQGSSEKMKGLEIDNEILKKATAIFVKNQ